MWNAVALQLFVQIISGALWWMQTKISVTLIPTPTDEVHVTRVTSLKWFYTSLLNINKLTVYEQLEIEAYP